MVSMLEGVRESFTLYLGAGLMLSIASLWAAVMAMKAQDRHATGRKRD
jgi:hypothetical protein